MYNDSGKWKGGTIFTIIFCAGVFYLNYHVGFIDRNWWMDSVFILTLIATIISFGLAVKNWMDFSEWRWG
jgi:hypothetical protein